MRKRLLLIGVAAGAIMLGLAGFAANTAQWVNVTAHVEKEIEMACVDPNLVRDNTPDPYSVTGYAAIGDGTLCDYETVFPQTDRTKTVEVTLSRSFFDQTTYSTVNFDVYWECKLVVEDALAQPDPSLPNYNPCRDDPNYTGTTPPPLDGNIRDYVDVGAIGDCLDPDGVTGPGGNAELEKLGDGSVQTARPKCFYTLTFHVPYCNGHYNPNTDNTTGFAYAGVDCDLTIADGGTEDDPQDWEHSTDLGDTFKIQVTGFVLAD
jgi:hypothetical protein